MIDPILTINFYVIALFAGILGSLLGIGGGLVIVPVLTVIFDIPIHTAIGASITAVVATSITSASSYVKEGLSNIRLGMFLEAGTTLGTLTGAIVAASISNNFLFIIFACLMVYSAYSMFRSRGIKNEFNELASQNDKLANILRLDGEYFDTKLKSPVHYYVRRTPIMLGVSYTAGILSGLLGVGGGVIKVPALVRICRLPIKAASATSNFMMGMTGAASALVYLRNDFIDPYIAAPVALGTLCGSLIGVRVMKRVNSSTLRLAFSVILAIVSIELFGRGFRIF